MKRVKIKKCFTILSTSILLFTACSQLRDSETSNVLSSSSEPQEVDKILPQSSLSSNSSTPVSFEAMSSPPSPLSSSLSESSETSSPADSSSASEPQSAENFKYFDVDNIDRMYFSLSNEDTFTARIFEGDEAVLTDASVIEEFMTNLKSCFKSLKEIQLSNAQSEIYYSDEPWKYQIDMFTSNFSYYLYFYDEFVAWRHGDTIIFVEFSPEKIEEIKRLIVRSSYAMTNVKSLEDNPEKAIITTG